MVICQGRLGINTRNAQWRRVAIRRKRRLCCSYQTIRQLRCAQHFNEFAPETNLVLFTFVSNLPGQVIVFHAEMRPTMCIH